MTHSNDDDFELRFEPKMAQFSLDLVEKVLLKCLKSAQRIEPRPLGWNTCPEIISYDSEPQHDLEQKNSKC